jgi:hypothetical protein
LALNKRAEDLAKKYKVSPFPISQVIDEVAGQDIDESAIDWDVIVQDTKDAGITVGNLWKKISEYYEISRPIEEISKLELQAIEQRAAEYQRSEVQQMLEDAIARIVEAERATINADIYNQLRELVDEVPAASSKRAQALLTAAIKTFEETITRRDAELQEGLAAPRSRPALRKAQERLKAPPLPEELVPEGFQRERAISTSGLEVDPLHPDKTIEVVRCLEIPAELSIFRSPDGRLYRVRGAKLTEVTRNDIIKLITPGLRKPLAIHPVTREIPLGVPIFQPGIKGIKPLDLGETFRKIDVIKAQDPEFYARAQAEGQTLQEIVEEYERTRGEIA